MLDLVGTHIVGFLTHRLILDTTVSMILLWPMVPIANSNTSRLYRQWLKKCIMQQFTGRIRMLYGSF